MSHQDRGAVVRWQRMYQDAEAILARIDVRMDVRTLGQRPDGRLAAGGRDRQGALARRPRADHGRADGGALGARGVRAVQADPPAHRLRRRGAVHQPPPRRGVRDRRPRDGAPRRPPHLLAADARRSRQGLAIREMVGRDMADFFVRNPQPPGEVLLRVDGLGREGAFSGVGFELRAGEVLGFAGLVGAGRTDVALALFGIAPADARRRRARRQAAVASARRARRCAPASPTCPRTAARSGCRCRSRSPPTSRWRRCAST